MKVFTSQMRAMNPSVCLLMFVSVLSSTQAGKLVFEQMVDVNQEKRCPDGSYCPNDETCCPTPSGKYGCCPDAGMVDVNQEKWCPDGSSCPNNKICCPTSSGKYDCCPYAGLVFEQMVDVNQEKRCPDGSSCPNDETCCPTPSGKYGCCPYAGAQSPPGSESLVCPDGSSCPGTAACCRTYVNSYTCCPYPNDVCCDDGRHCCARLTICDQRTLTCLPGDKSAPWDRPVASVAAIPAPEETMKLVPIVERQASPAPNIVCPGGGSCSGTAACCRTYSGQYNCCNYPTDVCCSDGLHCCARGTICDQKNLKCLPGEKSLPWDKPTPAIPAI
jgi:hypothetical protein